VFFFALCVAILVSMKDENMAIEQVRPEKACVGILPYESWEQLQCETSRAYAAFCAYRDYGLDRNIRKTVESVEKDVAMQAGKYCRWRKWACKYHWRERAADYDRYNEKLEQAEQRKTIEFTREKFRKVIVKILDIVEKKLDIMDPSELTQKSVIKWFQTAIEATNIITGLITPESKSEPEEERVIFPIEFQGL